MDQVRIGIIGFGGMGSHHGRYLSEGKVPGAVLGAVCDIDPARLEEARKIGGEGVKLFEDAEALMASGAVDAIMIATPHYFHPVYAIKGFEHGLHVLSEKPAGVYTKQVREMNERAAQSDRVFGVMFNQRTRTVHQKMRELVQGGTLGEIQRTNYVVTGWFRTQAYYNSGGWRATWAGEGGGVLVNQCPHNLDLFQWICGMPTRCFATCGFGQFHDIEVEDNCTAIFQYANGATGTFVTTTGEAPGAMMLEVCGDRGRLVMEHGKITFWQNQVSAREFLRTNPGSFAKPETWKIEIPGKDEGEEHVGITKNWVNAILNGTPLLASGSEGINGVQLANAMHLAAWTEGWVDMPVDEDLYFAKLQERIAGSTGKKDVTTAANDFAGSF